MLEILKFSLSGFWTFIGCTILFNGLAYFTVNGILRVITRTYRFFIMRKYGYPPSHCDSDGDFKQEKTNENGNT